MSAELLIQESMRLMRTGQRDAAQRLLEDALRADPNHPLANQVLGSIHAQSGRFPQAAACMEIAAAHAPNDAGVWVNLGMMRSTIADLQGAEDALRRAIDVNPRHVDGLLCLGILLANQQRTGDADSLFRRALDLAPTRVDVAHAYSRILSDTARTDEALAIIRAAQKHAPNDLSLQDKVCALLNYIAGVPPELAFKEHLKFGSMLGNPAATHKVRDFAPDRKLRIAYLSGDLREHSVAYFLEPLVEHHDRANFHTTCYHVGPPDDRVTPRLRAKSDAWRHLFPVNDDTLARTIADDNIDILIELAGHAQGNRLTAVARAPAPVCFTFIGYPNTTGVPAIGFRLIDDHTDPPGSDAFATERLIRLPGCFLCYRPSDAAPDVAPAPADRITFGSFNNLAKLSVTTVNLWARVLACVPGSTLLLKGKGLNDDSVRDRLFALLSKAGISSERVNLLGHTQSTREHLEAYSRMDIALDPFPYCGTTTTCEAMHMGTPVITLAGKTHASRVGISLLKTVGLPDLIARDEADYVTIATRLAADVPRREALRTSLRAQMLHSPLCQAEPYVRHVEAAFRSAWRDRCTQGAR